MLVKFFKLFGTNNQIQSFKIISLMRFFFSLAPNQQRYLPVVLRKNMKVDVPPLRKSDHDGTKTMMRNMQVG